VTENCINLSNYNIVDVLTFRQPLLPSSDKPAVTDHARHHFPLNHVIDWDRAKGNEAIHIRLYMAMPRTRPTYDSSHRSPTSRLDKDCGLQLPTSYVFLLLDCLLLDIAPSLSPVLAYETTYRLMSPHHHLCSPLDKS